MLKEYLYFIKYFFILVFKVIIMVSELQFLDQLGMIFSIRFWKVYFVVEGISFLSFVCVLKDVYDVLEENICYK